MSEPRDMDQDAFEQQCLDGIHAWVGEHFSGTVTNITRLERWRPQWKVTFYVNGTEQSVLFRGDRPIAGKHDLRFEMEVMQVLEANGIRVPHIFGWVDTPKAFVMDWVETEDRAPGMLHTAIDNPSTLSDERWQAMLAYMGHLASMHAVPVSEFAHIRRLSDPPATARDIALAAPEKMYAYAERSGEVDTTFQFLQLWLRRNVPEHRNEAHFIAGDAGQFMSAGTEVLALLDFEIANIGDTHWDLACFRGRHPYENMGDIPALYRRYGEITGEPVDLRVVGYHTVGFLQLSGIAAKFFMLPEVRGANWIEGMLEVASISRRAYEAVAELQAIPLRYDLKLPEPVIKPWEDSGLRKLMADIERLPTSTAFEGWERDLLHAIPSFLLNHARYRDWFEQEVIADISSLTGESYANLTTADAALAELINTADASMDSSLVPIMHRRTLRLSMIIAGTDPDDDNPLFHRLDPILN
ncbi:MAG: phosphotransferase [Pseudomonadota bacterium]